MFHFLERVLCDIVSELSLRITDTGHLSKIIDNLNMTELPPDSILVNVDMIHMFPNIDNNLGVTSVKKIIRIMK